MRCVPPATTSASNSGDTDRSLTRPTIRLLPAIAACFLAQLALAILVIPPWQNPDEPQHLQTVRLIASYGADFTLASHLDDPSEETVVRSMIEHGWWTHYGEPAPDPVPHTFAEGPALVVEAYFGPPGGGSRLYYEGVARLLRLADITGLLPQLYTMRVLSAVWAMLALLCVWLGTRAMLDEFSAAVVTTMMALHPQSVIVATTASPDAFVNLAGAALWWRAGVFLTSPTSALTAASVWAAAIAAFLIRRMGAPLLAFAALVTMGGIVRAGFAGHRRRAAWTIGLVAVVVTAAVLVWPALPDNVHRAFAWMQFDEAAALDTVRTMPDQLPRFLGALFLSFWVAVGWVRYLAPVWWYAATGVLCVAAIAGLARRDTMPMRVTWVVWLAWAMLAPQLVAVIAYHFGILQSGAQGRYLFPVLPAVLTLIWIGWRRWFPADRIPLAAVTLLTVLAVLSATAWMLVVLPAYV